MFSVDFVCRVPALSPARVFPTLPHSPWCLPFSTVSLGDFSELHTGGWIILLGCQLSLAYAVHRRRLKRRRSAVVGE
ncbi:hypothetical protein D8674_024237 [Pyrus ussuriensis x Pyrus communis]|uniref:Uncharacterized protein n=1 Tax=Pyrus ussuriensis x Pyrus communis TaxID=2448454 RepID=A0A5N5H2C7_9ROSA|nr:hypothetical protein D8674_024237 [Pyrus ussuriensis x Pyrus communis]